jgi:biotin synthase
VGDGVHLRALIEFSSYCRGSCKYCGLRAANRELQRYRMAPEDIVAAAVVARDLGYRTVVLQSGEDASYTGEMLAGVVREIKALCDVAVTMCVGERPEADYALWREAGADRYLLRIETSDPDLYATLHPGMSFDNRLRCLQTLRRLDYELGCGVLIGLPGQSDESRARDLLFLADLEPDMLGLGPFIPHPQTPIADALPADLTTTLRMTALARLLLPGAHIVATTALGTIDPAGRERGLSVGADVVMPNVTPQQFRALYEIYPGKICINETPDKCRGCIELRIRGLGRHVAGGKGGRPKDSFPQGVDRE